jgi:glyoxylase-like metal-dependent hydrolase (beta-lactamase superfamily II)
MTTTFTIHEVAGGVWAAVAPSTSGPAVSNAAIVDLGDSTIVVDTFMTGAAAEELAAEVARLTGRAAHLVVNSHWHSDHVRGNRVFDGVPIVGTERMRQLIIGDAPRTPETLETAAADLRRVADNLTAKATTPAEHTQAAGTRALADALLADAASYRLVVPGVLFGDRLDLAGERPAEILSYGRGHTESDVFVHLPDDGVVIAGDLVWTGVHPKTSDGFPQAWATVLDRLGELRPRHVVAGHGMPGTAADIAVMGDYLRHVDDMVAAARAGDLDPQQAPPPPGSDAWQDLPRFRAGLTKLAGAG